MYQDKKFTETINISSNIKANKKTIIGKFHLKDIFFILIASIIGIVVLSFLLIFLSIKNIFIIIIILALFEVPIITIGFLKIHYMPVYDYIKLKNKSDNEPYRKQVIKSNINKYDKYILIFVINDGDIQYKKLNIVMNDLKKIIPYENVQIKFEFNVEFLIIEVKNIFNVDYKKLFKYLNLNKNIKYISNEDVKVYEYYINSLKFVNKNYIKSQIKNINQNKNKLNKLNLKKISNNSFFDLTEQILFKKETEYFEIIKVILYLYPFDKIIINELKKYCSITIHTKIQKNNIAFDGLNFINTFLLIDGNIEEINDKLNEIIKILERNNILYKRIDEERVRDSILFLMENIY